MAPSVRFANVTVGEVEYATAVFTVKVADRCVHMVFDEPGLVFVIGIEYTTGKMIEYKKEALHLLHSFPASEIRNGFEDLVNFVTDRKY